MRFVPNCESRLFGFVVILFVAPPPRRRSQTGRATAGLHPLRLSDVQVRRVAAAVPEMAGRELRRRSRRLVRKADHEFPGLEKLDACDVVLVFFKRRNLKGEQLDRFKKFVTSAATRSSPCGPPATPCRPGSTSIAKSSAATTRVITTRSKSKSRVTDAGKSTRSLQWR